MEDLDVALADMSHQSLFPINQEFWRGKRVFLTGHTGFKGAWLLLWLTDLGAEVRGYARKPETVPSMFDILELSECCDHHTGELRDRESLRASLRDFEPHIVFHMAAQSLVRRSYRDPLETFETNVLGTANLLNACRNLSGLEAVVVVTTDKCYENREWAWAYRETDALGGADPYSASKACAELVTASYRPSYFSGNGTSGPFVATARAGNVFGGGDWCEDRLIPDAVRAFERDEPIVIRNPASVRPWQHVLDPLSGYLMLARALCERGNDFASAFNFGPTEQDCLSVRDLLETFIDGWGHGTYNEKPDEQGHEAGLLKLDSTRARELLGWSSGYELKEALTVTAEWYRRYYEKSSRDELISLTLNQIHTITSRLGAAESDLGQRS